MIETYKWINKQVELENDKKKTISSNWWKWI
jgi:hypothetical protein